MRGGRDGGAASRGQAEGHGDEQRAALRESWDGAQVFVGDRRGMEDRRVQSVEVHHQPSFSFAA